MIKIMKKTMVCVLLFIFFGISFDSKVVEAKNKKISTNRIKTIRQNVQYTYTDIDGKILKTFKDNKKHSYTDSDIKANKKYEYEVKAFYIEEKGKKEKKVWSPKGKITVSTKVDKSEKKKTKKKK